MAQFFLAGMKQESTRKIISRLLVCLTRQQMVLDSRLVVIDLVVLVVRDG